MLHRGDEVGVFEDAEMLGDGLPRHGEAFAKLVQRLPVPHMQPVEQFPPRRIRKRPEDVVHG